MKHRRAFTLVELLVVVAIISLLAAMLAPSLRRATFLARSTHCGANQHQISNGLTSYANANETFYPTRWPGTTGYYHPYWFGHPNNASKDLHKQFEKYLGPSVRGGPPEVLVCSVNPEGIWGRKIPWPMSGIYRSNVTVYAGYNWKTASANSCVPHQPLDQMPQRLHDVPDRPVSGDLIEYMSGNSSQGYSGWDTPHAQDPDYHNRGPNGPEVLPPDGIPFAFGDGSVRFTTRLQPCYTDAGWGTNYWPVP